MHSQKTKISSFWVEFTILFIILFNPVLSKYTKIDLISKNPLIVDPEHDFYRDLFTFKINDTNVYLIGVRHGADKSADLVKKTVQYLKPEAILLEVDNKRAANLVNFERDYSKVDIQAREYAKWLKYGKLSDQMNENVISEYSNLIDDLKIPKFVLELSKKVISEDRLTKILKYLKKQGKEIGVGYDECEKLDNCKFHFIDRDLEITWGRMRNPMSTFDQGQFMLSVPKLWESGERLADENELKWSEIQKFNLGIKNFRPSHCKTVFIDERDSFMVKKLIDIIGKNNNISENPKNLVMVVGVAHIEGILKTLINNQKISNLEFQKLLRVPKLNEDHGGKLVFSLISLVTILLVVSCCCFPCCYVCCCKNSCKTGQKGKSFKCEAGMYHLDLDHQDALVQVQYAENLENRSQESRCQESRSQGSRSQGSGCQGSRSQRRSGSQNGENFRIQRRSGSQNGENFRILGSQHGGSIVQAASEINIVDSSQMLQTHAHKRQSTSGYDNYQITNSGHFRNLQ